MSGYDRPNIPVRLIVTVGSLIVAAIVTLYVIGGAVTTVSQDEIVLKQSLFTGDVECWVTAGPKFQAWGTLTRYKKSSQYWFSAKGDEGDKKDQSIRVRFNDNGHGKVSGSLRYQLPLACDDLKALRATYSSQEAVEQQLVRTVVEKAVYLTGPLMSSKESAAERRGDLIQLSEDQILNGIFKTQVVSDKEPDPVSGVLKTVARTNLIKEAESPNGIARQEKSPFSEFKVRVSNFSMNGIEYDNEVEQQFQQQQKMLMQIQTAMASAKEAEQKTLTTIKQGEADAAGAKWKQEVIKATAVTQGEQEKEVALLEAQKKKEVAALNVQTAELYKREQTLIGEGDAARKRAAMVADGALTQKLQVYEKVMLAAVAQLGLQKQVLDVVMGNASQNGNPTMNMVDLLSLKAARDLSLDLRVNSGQSSPPVAHATAHR